MSCDYLNAPECHIPGVYRLKGFACGEIKKHAARERVAFTPKHKESQEFSIRRRDDDVTQLCARMAHILWIELKELNRSKFC
jgi:hypothetical protein